MKKTAKITLIAAIMCIGTAAFAAPHAKPEKDGLDIANGIVNLVLKVIRPETTVIRHAPAHFHKPPIHHHKPAKKVFHKPAPPKPRHR